MKSDYNELEHVVWMAYDVLERHKDEVGYDNMEGRAKFLINLLCPHITNEMGMRYGGPEWFTRRQTNG